MSGNAGKREGEPAKEETLYIGNRKSGKFHRASCPSVEKIKDVNRVELDSRAAALAAGDEPRKQCNP